MPVTRFLLLKLILDYSGVCVLLPGPSKAVRRIFICVGRSWLACAVVLLLFSV